MKRIALAFCSVVLVASCGRPANPTLAITKVANSSQRVAFVSNNPASFWTICEAGCRMAEKEFGVEVVFKKPDPGDAARQKEILDGLSAQGVGAIAVSVIDPKNQSEYLNELSKKQPLVCVDNDAPATRRMAYLGTDNYAAGREVGKLVKEAMPNGGTLAVFVGQLEALNARQRRQGLLDELAGKPSPADVTAFELSKDGEQYGPFKLMKTFTDQPTGETKAKENATDALLQLKDEPNVVMVGLWAYNPPAILSAVKEQNKLGQVKIVAFDEDFATLQGIADGHIYATVVQDPFNFGYESVKLMSGLVKGQPMPELKANPVKYVPHRIIVKEASAGRLAVAEFTAELRKLMGK